MYKLESRKSILFPMVYKSYEIDEQQMCSMKYGTLIKELWHEKSRIEWYFKCGLQELYNRSRGMTIHDPPLSANFKNRAGKKLDEILKEFPIKITTFLDICAGPGAFSDYLLRDENVIGYGITIPSTDAKNYYSSLRMSTRYHAIEADVNESTSMTFNDIDFVIADGAPDESEYKENLQELYSCLII